MPLGSFTNGEVYTIDRIAPTVLLSTSISEPTNVTPIPVTETFSEEVTGFDQNDLAVGNATVGNFSVVSVAVYTLRPAGCVAASPRRKFDASKYPRRWPSRSPSANARQCIAGSVRSRRGRLVTAGPVAKSPASPGPAVEAAGYGRRSPPTRPR